MHILKFFYTNTLSTAAAIELIDLLIVTDKFQADSCMRLCSQVLSGMPITRESAVLFLELPSSVLMAEAVQPLTSATKNYLISHYKDIERFEEELIKLPLVGIEALLESNCILVASEDNLYDFVLRWATAKYPSVKERHGVFCSWLARFICFAQLSCGKLKSILACPGFNDDIIFNLVLEALFFKVKALYGERTLAWECTMGERSYKLHPIKVVGFEHPGLQCVVYMDLKQKECENMFPSGRVYC